MFSKSRPLLHELRRGIAGKWYKYPPLLLISLGFCFSVFLTARYCVSRGLLDTMPTTMDYLLVLFSGMNVYVPDPNNPFQIPYIWLTLHLYIAFAVAGYPTRDLAGFGKHILMRSGTRMGWYLNKCGWATVNVLVCYIMVFAAPLVLTVATKTVSFIATDGETMAELVGGGYGFADPPALCRSVLLLPILVALALAMVQLFLESLLRPILSFTIIACLLLTSAYLYSPLLIGNFSMLLRSEYVLNEEGLTLIQGAIILPSIMVVAIIAGCLHFRKTDILDKN